MLRSNLISWKRMRKTVAFLKWSGNRDTCVDDRMRFMYWILGYDVCSCRLYMLRIVIYSLKFMKIAIACSWKDSRYRFVLNLVVQDSPLTIWPLHNLNMSCVPLPHWLDWYSRLYIRNLILFILYLYLLTKSFLLESMQILSARFIKVFLRNYQQCKFRWFSYTTA